ncbi:MAG: 30S ribosomal protein S15 [Candidatus Omnitrophota bacterium]
MVLVRTKKKEIIKEFKVHEKDTGSARVQIALISERINTLAEHFKSHKRDHASRLGLLKLVSHRRKLLDYLRKNDLPTYQQVVDKLELRK